MLFYEENNEENAPDCEEPALWDNEVLDAIDPISAVLLEQELEIIIAYELRRNIVRFPNNLELTGPLIVPETSLNWDKRYSSICVFD